MMETEKNNFVLAIDFGASGGKAIAVFFENGKLRTQEVHRFSNDPVILGDTMYWDVLRLFHEIKQCLIKSKSLGEISSIAVDTWGVDFGLLDSQGRLLENPVHYRDKRTEGMAAKASQLIDRDELYRITGNQIMEINTAFQLLALKEKHKDLLDKTHRLLMMPDLLHYFLCGEMVSEASISSTSQLYDIKQKNWSMEVLEKLGLPTDIFAPCVPSGTVIGSLSPAICEELDISPAKITAVCSHDTQSALAAVPAQERDFLFLSCGTWSLMGTELEQPVITEQSSMLNITNEAAYGQKTSFLKNIIGLWLVQESRRQWIREGKTYSFSQLEEMAREAKPFRSFIDPDDPVFVPAGNIPERIREFCRRTNQPVPCTEGEVIRCINESLALKYRHAKEEIEQCTQISYQTLYLIGGGTQSRLLCEMTACACDCRVSAGPTEATALGNAAVQFMALGEIDDLQQTRNIIRASCPIHVYEPKHSSLWEDTYVKYKELLSLT